LRQHNVLAKYCCLMEHKSHRFFRLLKRQCEDHNIRGKNIYANVLFYLAKKNIRQSGIGVKLFENRPVARYPALDLRYRKPRGFGQ
jgi:hypothetical protein